GWSRTFGTRRRRDSRIGVLVVYAIAASWRASRSRKGPAGGPSARRRDAASADSQGMTSPTSDNPDPSRADAASLGPRRETAWSFARSAAIARRRRRMSPRAPARRRSDEKREEGKYSIERGEGKGAFHR